MELRRTAYRHTLKVLSQNRFTSGIKYGALNDEKHIYSTYRM